MVKRKMAPNLGWVLASIGLMGWSGVGYAQADPYGALISPYIRIPSNMQTTNPSGVSGVTARSTAPVQVIQPVAQIPSTPSPAAIQVPAMPSLPDMPMDSPPPIAYIPPTPQGVEMVMPEVPVLPTPSPVATTSSVSIDSLPRLDIAPAKSKKSRKQRTKAVDDEYAAAPALAVTARPAASSVDIASLPVIDISANHDNKPKKNKRAKMLPHQPQVMTPSVMANQSAPTSLELPSLPNETAGAGSGQVVASVSDAFREAEARRRDVQSLAGQQMRDVAGYEGPVTEPTIKQLRELIPAEVISELRKQEQDLQIAEKPGFIERVIPRVARKSYPQQLLLEQPPVMIDLAKGKIDVNKPKSQQFAKAKTPSRTASMNFNPGLPIPANGGGNYLQVYDLKTSAVLMTQPKPKTN